MVKKEKQQHDNKTKKLSNMISMTQLEIENMWSALQHNHAFTTITNECQLKRRETEVMKLTKPRLFIYELYSTENKSP